MNANEREWSDDVSESENGDLWKLREQHVSWLHGDVVYQAVGCAMKVHRTLGHGLREKTYERALCLEFAASALSFSQQKRFPIMYRGQQIDEFVPDLIVKDCVIVDTKTVDCILDAHIGQLLNYLRVANLHVGLILNFKHPRLQWRRVVLEESA